MKSLPLGAHRVFSFEEVEPKKGDGDTRIERTCVPPFYHHPGQGGETARATFPLFSLQFHFSFLGFFFLFSSLFLPDSFF